MSDSNRTSIRAEALRFSELFRKGQFSVPRHQRYYDWKEDNVEELLFDLKEAVEESRESYFLGTIMLIENSEKKWIINDGQQRMITLSLMFAVVCRKFSSEQNKSQMERLALELLFDLDSNKSEHSLSESDTYTPRIEPPQNDKTQYNHMIRGREIGTNGKLTKAWEIIHSFFVSMEHAQAKEYFDFLTSKLEIACLFLPHHVDTNAIYETINCRGKRPGELDLIRNYLYSHFNETSEIERGRSIHESLEKMRTVIPHIDKSTEYARCSLQCEFGFIRKDNFYRDVRVAIRQKRNIDVRDYLFNLVGQMTDSATLDLFKVIITKNYGFEFMQKFKQDSGTTRSKRNLENFIQELRGYKVTHPLIFAMLNLYIKEKDKQQRKGLAKKIHRNIGRLNALVLRTVFAYPKFEPSHFERAFSNYAQKIHKAKSMLDDDFVNFLMERDKDDSFCEVLINSDFREALREQKMTHTPKIRAFLWGINNFQQSDSSLLSIDRCTVEHVLPKSDEHWVDWTGFSDDAGDYVDKIGNLTLLGHEDNKPSKKDNADFSKKSGIYKDSALTITRDLTKHQDWNPQNVASRQKELIDAAIKVWKFNRG